jgi:hypothetical protein
MSDEIDLQDLIFQVKHDLLAPNPKAGHRDPYPLLAVEKIELELVVKVTREQSQGIKVTVLDRLDWERGASEARERGHVIRVTLAPLVPTSDVAAQILADPKVREAVMRDVRQALIKGGGPLAGPSE